MGAISMTQNDTSVFSAHFRSASGAGRYHCRACGTRSSDGALTVSILLRELHDHLQRCDRVSRESDVPGHVTIDGERTEAALMNGGETLFVALPEKATNRHG